MILRFARFALSLLIYQAISFVLDAERPEFVGLAFTGGFLCIYSPITTSIYWEKVLSQFLLPSHPPDPPCARYLTRQPNIEVIWSTAFIGKPWNSPQWRANHREAVLKSLICAFLWIHLSNLRQSMHFWVGGRRENLSRHGVHSRDVTWFSDRTQMVNQLYYKGLFHVDSLAPVLTCHGHMHIVHYKKSVAHQSALLAATNWRVQVLVFNNQQVPPHQVVPLRRNHG